MEKERLVVLKAEINSQIQEIEGVYTRLEDRDRKKDQAAIERRCLDFCLRGSDNLDPIRRNVKGLKVLFLGKHIYE